MFWLLCMYVYLVVAIIYNWRPLLLFPRRPVSAQYGHFQVWWQWPTIWKILLIKVGEWAELIVIVIAELILQPFHHFTYVTTHSRTLLSLYLRQSSFSSPSVASPTPQLIPQPFFCFSYVTGFSLNVAWRAAHAIWWKKNGKHLNQETDPLLELESAAWKATVFSLDHSGVLKQELW